MKIEEIQEEKIRKVDKQEIIIKEIKDFDIINEDAGSMHCNKNIGSYIFYLLWTDDENIDYDDILLNLDGNKHNKYNKHLTRYSNSKENFIIIELKSEHAYFNHHRGDDPVNLHYNGSIFLIGIQDTILMNNRNLIFQYKSNECHTIYKKIKYDVGCKYKNKSFGFEIGNSNHDKRERVLILDYDYLSYSSYIEIKKRIKSFLIKYSKEK